MVLPSGKLTFSDGKDPPFSSWVNPRTKSPFSIATLNYQRVMVKHQLLMGGDNQTLIKPIIDGIKVLGFKVPSILMGL